METEEPRNTTHFMEADPHSEAGYAFWLASHPLAELTVWLAALQKVGARLVFVMPWQRAFLGAGKVDLPSALYLTVTPGSGHLLFFRGRSLAHARVFPLPADMDLHDPSVSSIHGFCSLATEELSRLLQFLRQKYRGQVQTTLCTIGLPETAGPALAVMGEKLGLDFVTNLGSDLPTFLLLGAARERRRKGALDLLPQEIRDAGRERISRVLVWAAAGWMTLVGPGTKLLLARFEAGLGQEALLAESARDARRAKAREGDKVARQRFGVLRLRKVEARQKRAMECLEAVGLRIFQVPQGVHLEKVEIQPAPGGDPAHRFTLKGTAVTRKDFSVGSLAVYYDSLAAGPGVKLEPLRNVMILDPARPVGQESRPEQASTQFQIEGGAP